MGIERDNRDDEALVVIMTIILVAVAATSPYKPSAFFLTEECYWAEGIVTDKYYEQHTLHNDYWVVFNGTLDNSSQFNGSVYVPLWMYLYVPVGYTVQGVEFCEVETVKEWIANGNLTLNLID